MKKILLITALFFLSSFAFSQESEEVNTKISHFFTQFDVTIPIVGNPDAHKEYINGIKNTNRNWFVPDGINAKIGYGIQQSRWVGLSLHTGIDWKATEKLVAVPVYANFRFSPSLGYGARVTMQFGYGKAFALGRGNLSGTYKKISLGVETEEDLIIFIEVADYQMKVGQFNSVGSVSLGIALRTF